jgi:hypothetical protein
MPGSVTLIHFVSGSCLMLWKIPRYFSFFIVESFANVTIDAKGFEFFHHCKL